MKNNSPKLLKNLFGQSGKKPSEKPEEMSAEELDFPQEEESVPMPEANDPDGNRTDPAYGFAAFPEQKGETASEQDPVISPAGEKLTKEERRQQRAALAEERKRRAAERKENRGEHFGSLFTEEEREEMAESTFQVSYLFDTPNDDDIISPRDANRNRDISLLCYLPWLFWIPFLLRRRSRFVRFHANQGMLLSLLVSVWWLIEYYLTRFFNYQMLYFLSILLGALNIIVLVLIGFGILSCTNERARELPVIGRFRIISTIRKKKQEGSSW